VLFEDQRDLDTASGRPLQLTQDRRLGVHGVPELLEQASKSGRGGVLRAVRRLINRQGAFQQRPGRRQLPQVRSSPSLPSTTGKECSCRPPDLPGLHCQTLTDAGVAD
jgi:hypothetical protein